MCNVLWMIAVTAEATTGTALICNADGISKTYTRISCDLKQCAAIGNNLSIFTRIYNNRMNGA